jgi:hypothetical protein
MPEMGRDPNEINGSPTKDFFIYTLIRDIPLNRAVIDLVDNSVDGARRIRDGTRFDGLWVRLKLNADYFRISDNCGGIPIDTAREYAFRFGRPKDAPPVEGSIGQFGVGMKRSFFKLGKLLRVESATASTKFAVEVDADVWKARKSAEGEEDWHFQFKSLEQGINVPVEEQGTTIEIKGLHASVAESFALDPFITRLAQEVAVAHSESMDNGLNISINGIPLQHDPLHLLQSTVMQPAHVELVFETPEVKPVSAKLYAGVADRSKEEGGWYVFCNGRLVVRADQTNLTVWGEGERVPKYHPDFARFRGLAYFDSDDSSLLPWTTTKTGVDADSPVYRAVRQQMIELTRPVLEFLRKLEDERKKHTDGDIQDNPLAQAVESAQPVGVTHLTQHPVFVAPSPPPLPPGPRMQRIQYSKPVDQVEKAKELLGVISFKDVGEKTFEYYMRYEGGESAT